MKFIKWLLISLVCVVLLLGVGTAALVYLVDWNDFKNTIQNQAKKHTGRDLIIAGDLSPSVFPWVGISIGDVSLANAEGYGDMPFAKVGSADVKVELLPLLKKTVNVRTVELKGLSLDLQRNADGTTNWDDLVAKESSTTTTDTEDKNKAVEVEGDSAAIVALEVGGIDINDANVSWRDAQSGTDASLEKFNLKTGAIELAKPFPLSMDFTLNSNSMGMNANVKGSGNVMIDLDNQVYSLQGLTIGTQAKGDAFPAGELDVTVAADIDARLEENKLAVKSLVLDAFGIKLKGDITVDDLDIEPTITGNLSSDEFNPQDLFAKLDIPAPQTADNTVMQKASISLALAASTNQALLNELSIVLDDTTFTGNASASSLDAEIPPLRFEFSVNTIDLDRYLPPVAGAEAGDNETGDAANAEDSDTSSSSEANTVAATTGDEPLDLPVELMKKLDIEGTFTVGNVKVSNLTTKNIVVPVVAKDGRLSLSSLTASLYEGDIKSTAVVDVNNAEPAFAFIMELEGIQADPLLADLTQKDALLSGKGKFAADMTTNGNSVNAITNGLNGTFNMAFNDGSINGVNLGYQLRRAKAALSGQTLPENAESVKTDFSELSLSGTFTDGVMQSDDLDMRSPLLRVNGAGMMSLPEENVDYTVTTLVTGSAQGQGGAELESLKGVKFDIPIRGTFAELSANFAGVMFRGMKDNITSNLKGQAEALAKQKADELKAQAQKELDAKKAEAQALLDAKEEEAKQRLEEEKAAAEAKADEAVKKGTDKLKGKLEGLLK